MTQQIAVESGSEKRTPYDWLIRYRYEPGHGIERASVGAIAHRLRNLMIKMTNETYGPFEYPELTELVSKTFKQLERLFFVGGDGTEEMFAAEEMFQFRNPRPQRKKDQKSGRTRTVYNNLRSWRNDFRMGDQSIKTMFHAKASFVALTQALAAKVDYLAEREFGRKIVRKIEEKDPKTKKTRTRTEREDTRTYHRRSSSGIIEVFAALDAVQTATKKLGEYSFELFSDVVETLDSHKDKAKSKRPKTPKKKVVIVESTAN